METTTIQRWSAKPPRKYDKESQGKQILAVGEKRGFDFAFLGTAPVPREPVYIPGWWIIPATQDQSQIPARSLQRIRLLFDAGLRPAAFVIVHEAPQALPAPSVLPEKIKTTKTSPEKEPDSLLTGLLSGVSLALPLVFLAGLALLDPILVAITEEQEWIEIDRWNVESR